MLHGAERSKPRHLSKSRHGETVFRGTSLKRRSPNWDAQEDSQGCGNPIEIMDCFHNNHENKEVIIMKYVYPAILTPEDDGVIVSFPDVEGAYADGATIEEALDNAEDVLNVMLLTMEEQHKEIHPPTPLASLRIPEGSTTALVRADTLAYSRKVDTRAVRKSVSIPAWMDALAKDHNLNLSNVLQNAIRRELNIA